MKVVSKLQFYERENLRTEYRVGLGVLLSCIRTNQGPEVKVFDLLLISRSRM